MSIRICPMFFVVLTLVACVSPIVAVPPTATMTPRPTPSPTRTPVPPSAMPARPTPAQKPYQDLVVGYVQMSGGSTWRVANILSVKETAEQLGVILMLSDAMGREGQIKVIRAFIAEEVDVIGISPLAETGWDTVFQEAKDAGIPIILVDRPADVPEGLYATYLASDFVEQGRKAGRAMAELVDGQANVVELMGTEGYWVANERNQGFRQVLPDYSKMKIIGHDILMCSRPPKAFSLEQVPACDRDLFTVA